MSFLNKETAHRLREKGKATKFKYIYPEDAVQNLAYFKIYFFNPKGSLITAIASGGRTIQSAPFIDNRKENSFEQNLLSQIDITHYVKKHKKQKNYVKKHNL